MLTAPRRVFLVFATLVSLHLLLAFTNGSYGRVASLSNIKESVCAPSDSDEFADHDNPSNHAALPGRANATLLMLARNEEVDGAVKSMRSLEDRFNHKYNYPWVFLNDVPFDETFISMVKNIASGPVYFDIIPHDHWYQPEWIDEHKAEEGRNNLVNQGVIYGGSVSYRNMCRFNSGFFYRLPVLKQFKWYWRVEPDIQYHCDITYDPFVWMEKNDKVYGFTIIAYEFMQTIPTLWETTRKFMAKYPHLINPQNAVPLLSPNDDNTYNGCHFWSNFEIASLDFWRGEAYSKYFDYIDATGGFYYERWGDAPVHSIGAGLFLRSDQIHWFSDIGYEHNPNMHCPGDKATWERNKCSCKPENSFAFTRVCASGRTTPRTRSTILDL
ncbi:glycosyltransferase family 15 protein [Cytidiella melzeri]|nr:glycosyltransferase family 15 protein [Cytidiella melzeri]